jgi:hypothetical protein
MSSVARHLPIFPIALSIIVGFGLSGVLPSLGQQPGQSMMGPGMEPVPLPHPDLPPPVVPESGLNSLWLWGALSVALVAIAVLIWALFRSQRSSPPKLPKARREAMRALKELGSEAPTLAPADTAGRVSDIVRRYLQLAYQIPAPRRTSSELFHPTSTPESVKAVAPLADLWDRLAFGPPISTRDEASALVQKALQHVESEVDVSMPNLAR